MDKKKLLLLFLLPIILIVIVLLWGKTSFRANNLLSRISGGFTESSSASNPQEGNRSLMVVSGEESTTQTKTILKIKVLCRMGHLGCELSGILINFVTLEVPQEATNYALNPTSVLTDSSGEVSTTFYFGDKPGRYKVKASVADDPTASVELNLVYKQAEEKTAVGSPAKDLGKDLGSFWSKVSNWSGGSSWLLWGSLFILVVLILLLAFLKRRRRRDEEPPS